MKCKIVYCWSRTPIDDKETWIYTWRQFTNGISGYDIAIKKHQVPWFLSLHAHLVYEELLEDLLHRFLLPFVCKKLLLIYDILYGFVCGYNMREILAFWRKRE